MAKRDEATVIVALVVALGAWWYLKKRASNSTATTAGLTQTGPIAQPGDTTTPEARPAPAPRRHRPSITVTRITEEEAGPAITASPEPLGYQGGNTWAEQID